MKERNLMPTAAMLAALSATPGCDRDMSSMYFLPDGTEIQNMDSDGNPVVLTNKQCLQKVDAVMEYGSGAFPSDLGGVETYNDTKIGNHDYDYVSIPLGVLEPDANEDTEITFVFDYENNSWSGIENGFQLSVLTGDEAIDSIPFVKGVEYSNNGHVVREHHYETACIELTDSDFGNLYETGITACLTDLEPSRHGEVDVSGEYNLTLFDEYCTERIFSEGYSVVEDGKGGYDVVK